MAAGFLALGDGGGDGVPVAWSVGAGAALVLAWCGGSVVLVLVLVWC